MTIDWTTISVVLGMKPKLFGLGIGNKTQMNKFIQLSGPSNKKRVRRSKSIMRGS
jgi:hypothetical protein